MNGYRGVPVTAAKRIAKEFDKDQVIVVTWDAAHGKTHVTTYGKTVEECAQAAEGGNLVKRALGWPESLCDAAPPRVKRLKAVERTAKALAKDCVELDNGYLRCIVCRRQTHMENGQEEILHDADCSFVALEEAFGKSVQKLTAPPKKKRVEVCRGEHGSGHFVREDCLDNRCYDDKCDVCHLHDLPADEDGNCEECLMTYAPRAELSEETTDGLNPDGRREP